MSASVALASMTVVRPDGPVPAALDRTVRTAITGAWRALEVALAGSAISDKLVGAPAVRAGAEAVLSLVGDATPRVAAVAELRAAHPALDASFDLKAVLASCGRAGDSPAVVAGRRRVRTMGQDALRRAFAGDAALSTALRDSNLVTLLVDTARALFRHATRTDR